jgi:single-stranded-DNA-specific exonuclease
LIGQKHLKLTLRSIANKESSDDKSEEKEVEAIWFNINPNIWPNFRLTQAKIVYRLGINEYNGRRNLQLMIDEVI